MRTSPKSECKGSTFF